MKKIKIILIIIVLGFLLLGTKLYLEHNAKPNIILITFDALRADHLGFQGYPKNTSPFLDALSKKSLTFTNCIAVSGTTVPAVSALFTSRFPYIDGAVTDQYTLGENYITLAEFLKGKGYNTLAIPGHYYLKTKFGFSRGFDYFDDNYIEFRTADEILARTIELFERKNNSGKFFLWIHFREPHSPYNPPEEYIERLDLPAVPEISQKAEYTIYGKKRILTDKAVRELIARYDGNIKFADSNLRKIFDYLQKKNFFKKTIVIITADHGESLGEHNIFDHNKLYYGILHVPLIIKIPGGQGKVVNNSVSAIDIFPTILDLLGYRKYISQLQLRGKSLLEESSSSDICFSEYPGVYSIIKENWRLYRDFSNNTKLLFDINTDPLEAQDLSDNHRDVYQTLNDQLSGILGVKKDVTMDAIDKKALLNKEDIMHLRSLGYIN
ncbi:MAG: sulfatase [Candidatus Omnitrophica bacterium]|nr:sulfatase [Candidatus Omnitrophota bacterium]